MTIFWRKTLALCIDYLISSFSATIIFLIIYLPAKEIMNKYLFVYLLCAVLWCSLKDISGRSFGQHIMQLCIVDLKTNRSPILLKRIFRNLLFVFLPLEVVFMAARKDKRRFLDVLFGIDVAVQKSNVRLYGEDKPDLPSRTKAKKLLIACIVLAVLGMFPFISIATVIVGAISHKTGKKYLSIYPDNNPIRGILSGLNIIGVFSIIYGILGNVINSLLYMSLISLLINSLVA